MIEYWNRKRKSLHTNITSKYSTINNKKKYWLKLNTTDQSSLPKWHLKFILLKEFVETAIQIFYQRFGNFPFDVCTRQYPLPWSKRDTNILIVDLVCSKWTSCSISQLMVSFWCDIALKNTFLQKKSTICI